MRIFGLDIAKAPPKLRAANTAFDERSAVNAIAAARLAEYSPRSYCAPAGADVLKAVGELPTYVPPSQRRPAQSLDARAVPSDPLADWWLSLPDLIPPKQVDSMLRMALAGNLWQQAILTNKMGDTWPMFKKCAHELRSAVAACKYIVHPYAANGEEPTKSAKEKADLVARCLDSFAPNRFADEDSKSGLVYDLTDAVLNGIAVCELLWNPAKRTPRGKEQTPRASAFVHQRHLTFTPDGGVGIAATEPDNLLQFPSQLRGVPLIQQPDKFLVARFKSKSGSSLGAGLMRCLAWYWVAVTYGKGFAIAFAQKYGNPFMDLAYSGMDGQAVTQLENFARRAVNQGWIVHDSRATVNIHPAQSMAGNPTRELMKDADEACMLLLLGQTLTSQVSKDGGSRALGDVHADVKSERVQGVAQWIAEILTSQFAESVLRVNYGEVSERPTVAVDTSRALTVAEKTSLLGAISNSTVPVPVKEAYTLLDLPQPEPGDVVLVRGEHTVMEEAVTATEKRQQAFEEQLGNQQVVNQALGGQQGEEGREEDEEEAPDASAMAASLRRMTPEQLDAFERDLVTAEASPRLNGQWEAITARLKG